MSKNCEHLVSLNRNRYLKDAVEKKLLSCSQPYFCDWRIPFTEDDVRGQNIACNLADCPVVRNREKKAA